MFHIEIELASDEALVFDQMFWRYVWGELNDSAEPDVELYAAQVGELHRRVVSFSSPDQSKAFERYCLAAKPWKLALRRVPEPEPRLADAPCAAARTV